jgi:transcriptional regulator NrdR family protein
MIRLMRGLLSRCCPYCKSIDFRIVDARSALEETFHWLLQPFRCGLCGHHFFLFRWLAPIGGEAS